MSQSHVRAKVIADSIGPTACRITTLEVTMHRFVLAEFNTHRVFSRNSASSRAIPVRKIIRNMIDELAIPLSWTSEQSGMVGGDQLTDQRKVAAERVWQNAAEDAIRHAKLLIDLGVHKSIVNRLLEPFMMHTVIVTSTEWDNFFNQRCHPDAQPEIQATANAMRDALNASTLVQKDVMDWHLPYIQDDEHDLPLQIQQKISVARCARVSYLTHDGVRHIEKDIELHDRLLRQNPPHASPFEHVAQCAHRHRFANFVGWMSLRFAKGI